jgi:hypothetical protein
MGNHRLLFREQFDRIGKPIQAGIDPNAKPIFDCSSINRSKNSKRGQVSFSGSHSTTTLLDAPKKGAGRQVSFQARNQLLLSCHAKTTTCR